MNKNITRVIIAFLVSASVSYAVTAVCSTVEHDTQVTVDSPGYNNTGVYQDQPISDPDMQTLNPGWYVLCSASGGVPVNITTEQQIYLPAIVPVPVPAKPTAGQIKADCP